MVNNGIHIKEAEVKDAVEILKLQKIAYISEAAAHDDFTIPPLHQTIKGVLEEFKHQVFLKAMQGNQIIGSVRGYEENGTCYIGKLIVDPEWQDQGIGTRLVKDIERWFPDAKRYELFTGHKSEKNLYMYQKMGYDPFKGEAVSPKLTIIYLEKEGENA